MSIWTGSWVIQPSIFSAPTLLSGTKTVNASDENLARLSIGEEVIRSELQLVGGETVRLLAQRVHVSNLHQVSA